MPQTGSSRAKALPWAQADRGDNRWIATALARSGNQPYLRAVTISCRRCPARFSGVYASARNAGPSWIPKRATLPLSSSRQRHAGAFETVLKSVLRPWAILTAAQLRGCARTPAMSPPVGGCARRNPPRRESPSWSERNLDACQVTGCRFGPRRCRWTSARRRDRPTPHRGLDGATWRRERLEALTGTRSTSALNMNFQVTLLPPQAAMPVRDSRQLRGGSTRNC